MLNSDIKTYLMHHFVLYSKYVHSICRAIATIAIWLNTELYR